MLRFRLRTMLLVVAAVGVAAGGLIVHATDRRRDQYRLRVESFAFGEADVIEQIAEKLREAREAEAGGPEGQQRAAELRSRAEELARVAAWHVKMERRYAWAVDHPWEPLPPDIPAPE
jgi:hypothetical protein